MFDTSGIAFKFSIYPSHKAPWVIFVKVNAGLLTLLDAATKVVQEEMIRFFNHFFLHF